MAWGLEKAIALAWEMGQHDIGLELAEHGGEASDGALSHQQHGIILAEEVHILEPQDAARLADLLRFHIGTFRHHFQQLIADRHLFPVEHGVADDLVMHARAVRQDDAGHVVAPRGVMGHRAAGLVEDVRGMCADG